MGTLVAYVHTWHQSHIEAKLSSQLCYACSPVDGMLAADVLYVCCQIWPAFAVLQCWQVLSQAALTSVAHGTLMHTATWSVRFNPQRQGVAK